MARLAYVMPRAGQERIAVYDVQGRRVARPVDAVRPPGRHATAWNARAAGLAPGLYFMRFEALERVVTREFVLLR